MIFTSQYKYTIKQRDCKGLPKNSFILFARLFFCDFYVICRHIRIFARAAIYRVLGYDA